MTHEDAAAYPTIIERLHPGHEVRLRDMRLRALRDSPDAFDTLFDEAVQWPADHWQRQLRNLATFVALLGRDDIGLVRGATSDDDPAVAYLISMWVAPVVRRRHVGTQLIGAVTGWAKDSGFSTLRLDVASSNVAAMGLYERAGFRRTGRSGTLAPPREHIHEVEMETALRDA